MLCFFSALISQNNLQQSLQFLASISFKKPNRSVGLSFIENIICLPRHGIYIKSHWKYFNQQLLKGGVSSRVHSLSSAFKPKTAELTPPRASVSSTAVHLCDVIYSDTLILCYDFLFIYFFLLVLLSRVCPHGCGPESDKLVLSFVCGATVHSLRRNQI